MYGFTHMPWVLQLCKSSPSAQQEFVWLGHCRKPLRVPSRHQVVGLMTEVVWTVTQNRPLSFPQTFIRSLYLQHPSSASCSGAWRYQNV